MIALKSASAGDVKRSGIMPHVPADDPSKLFET